MTKADVVQLFMLISVLYPRDDTFKNANSVMVSTWAEMLSDMDFGEIKTALKMHTAKSQFPPSIAELRNFVADLHDESSDMTAEEAWTLVFSAITRSAYSSVEEFDRLPEICRRLVGSPRQLKEWALSDSFNPGVEKALFTKSYNTRQQKLKEFNALPLSVKEMISSTTDRLLLN